MPPLPPLGMRDRSWGARRAPRIPCPVDGVCGQGEELHRWHRGHGECRTAPTAQTQPPQPAHLCSPEILPRVSLGLLQAYDLYWKSVLPVSGAPKVPL